MFKGEIKGRPKAAHTTSKVHAVSEDTASALTWGIENSPLGSALRLATAPLFKRDRLTVLAGADALFAAI